MQFRYRALVIRGIALTCFLAATAGAQDTNWDEVSLETTAVSDGIHMIKGAGGNIGVFSGPDGVFVIDDQFAPLTTRILEQIAGISDGNVRFLINTHWHFDHTGGNENMAGAGALIVAHDNVRRRMSTDQLMEAFNREVPASPKAALPVVTFTEGVSFHLNGERIEVFHVPHAHTDGDAIIRFHESNVVHMGDVLFYRRYPFIDTGSGGSIDGVIAAVDGVLEFVDDETRVIPGHGPMTDRAGLEEYRGLLATVRDRISAFLAEGKSLEEVVAAAPTADFDEVWGQGFLGPDKWVSLIYADLAGKDH